ncbi:glycosyltransferase [Aureliella helgolandensis]|uniref:SPBc2 prophage-derived glycosyltransferase SunS n=1 Tax=Aureliella helgolandensis TaxID=2527968 RepID=A0A518G4L6_9BACT|nr:glycosyltransferase [Aureliella helgolandensis]QDV23534.1 SPBc2 prophage-derived glycosyltransferase SunS [Aureliella helgolandensis]
MEVQPVAVVGTYRSGSSMIAAMLHELGVDMGAPFWGNYYEPQDLAQSLRRWWTEPQLIAAEPASNRILLLRQWFCNRLSADCKVVGAKHPLLTLSINDLMRAWGPHTKLIWSRRELDDSIQSLKRTDWWPSSENIQQQLWTKLAATFPRQGSLIIDFEETQNAPVVVVEKLVDFLKLAPSPEAVSRAVSVVRTNPPAPKVPLPKTLTRSGRTRIACTVLAGSCEELIGDALESVVDWVDQVLLIDTGIEDKTLDVARAVAGSKLQLATLNWSDDFAKARNLALELAQQTDATWALTLDTDERLRSTSDAFTFHQLIELLETHDDVDLWLVESSDGQYSKERLIRLPTTLQWQGRTHEALVSKHQQYHRRVLPHLVFDEIPKPPEAMRRKLERDHRILREDLKWSPENGRAWYYLGQTLANLLQHEGAIAAFDRCASIHPGHELAAWACYMGAKCCVELGLLDEAISRCGIGLSIDACFPELAWMSGWCYFKQQNFQQAVAWSHIAISLGCVEGIGEQFHRIGFRDLVGWYEGPYDVLRFSPIPAGGTEANAAASSKFEQAAALRKRKQKQQSSASTPSL